MLERAKSSILRNGNFREFFLWRGEFCVFKMGIPGGPGRTTTYSERELEFTFAKKCADHQHCSLHNRPMERQMYTSSVTIISQH